MNDKHDSESSKTPFQRTVGQIDTIINSTHILLAFVIEKYKQNESLAADLPELERHLHMLGQYAGVPAKGDAEVLLEMIKHAPTD